MNISLVMSSCDSYSDLWKPFFIQLVKHWPSFNTPVYIVSENKNFSFEGLNITCPLSKIEKKSLCWSYLLIETLKRVETEYVLFFLDDFWLTKDVNLELLEKSYKYMKEHNDIGFICLRNQNSDSLFKGKVPDFPEMFECLKGKPYRITTQTGLWRKDFLLKVLKKHESAWQFETRATWRAYHYYHEKILIIDKEEDRVFFYPNAGVCQARCFINQYKHLYDQSLFAGSNRGFIDYDDPNRVYPDKQMKFSIADLVSKFKSILP